MTFQKLFLTLLLFAATSAFSQQQPSEIEATLKTTFMGKIVTLRNFYTKNTLEYDENGKLEGTSEKGAWTLASKLKITRVSFTKGNKRLSIAGTRVFVGTDKDGKLKMYATPESLDIQIKASSPPNAEAIAHALSVVLLRGNEDMGDVVPYYWKSYFRPQLLELPGDPSNPGPLDAYKADNQKQDEKPAQPAATLRPLRVRVSQGVVAANLIGKTTPIYPEVAKRYRQSGSVIMQAVIGTDGTIKDLRIVKPAGMGLDEAAAEAVRLWKYKPYLLNGEPVDVETQITVNFTISG